MRCCSQHCCWVHLRYVYLNTGRFWTCLICSLFCIVFFCIYLWTIIFFCMLLIDRTIFGRAWYVVCFVMSLHIFVDDNFFLYAINTYDNSIVNTQYYLKGMNFVVGYCYVWRRRDKHRTTKLNNFQIFSWQCISTFFSTKSVKKQVIMQ